jgi:poly-gamma-glutamate capsule biosynthesis protein CapA/YwtB (metallophosphatase superfamily)
MAHILPFVEDFSLRELLKVMIAEAAIFVVLACWLWNAKVLKTTGRWIGLSLAVLAVFAATAYAEFGYLRFGVYMNPHDFFHYYLGAKYSPEVGYYDLYRCALVASVENGETDLDQVRIRKLENYRYMPAKTALSAAAVYKSRFSDQRWDEFKTDVAYFRSMVPDGKWRKMLRDKGYNATPVWNMVARVLANRAPTRSLLAMGLLAILDPLLIAVMFACVWRAFGWRTCLLGIIFFGTNFAMGFPHIKGAFLRLDWLAGLVIATCLIKRNHYKSAGAVMAYAASARIFPVVWLFGLGAKLAWGLMQERRIERRYLHLLGAFVLTAAVLVGASCLADGGVDRWGDFFEKIGMHNEDIADNRVGFKYILVWPEETGVAKAQAFESRQAAWLTAQALVLLVAFVAARRVEDYETIPLGFVPAFFLAAPTFYYYVVLVVVALMFAPKLGHPLRAFGLAGMFSISIVCYVMHQFWALRYVLSFAMSCLLLALAIYILIVALMATPAQSHPTSSANLAAAVSALRSLLRRRVLWTVLVLVALAVASYAALRSRERRDAAAFEPTGDEVELLLAGDVMLARNVARSIEKGDRDFTFPFSPTADLTSGADLAFCNLESPISGRGEEVEKKYTFNAPPEAVDGLVFAGFDVISLANNHILDYGPLALEDTIEHLTRARIGYVGLCQQDRPQIPLIVETRGVRIAFLAYADPKTEFAYAKEFLDFDTRPAEGLMQVIQRDLRQVAREADVIVVSLHWGTEYKTQPDARQKDLGRFIIDQGADIVAGHHPHVQQEPEWHNDGLIIYSMGNFIFDQHSRPPTRISRLYRVYVTRQGVRGAGYLPLEIVRDGWQAIPRSDEFIRLSGP